MHNYSTWIKETNPVELMKTFKEKLKSAGFGIEGITEKHFSPVGFTALFLLSESHFAIHTFPEEKETYIELSSCVAEPFYKFISNA